MRMFALISALTLLGGSVASGAVEGPTLPVNDAPPDATLMLNEGRLSTGVNYMWGRGQLKFRAGQHAVHISGAPVAVAGSLTLSAIGEVYCLTQLSDFSGTYSAVKAATPANSAGAAVSIRNEHGVLLVLRVAATTPPASHTSGNIRIQLSE